MEKILLIDGDFIPWRICPNQVPTETERMYGVSFDKTLEQVLEGLDYYMTEKILKPTKIDNYLAFLGGEGNFRMSLISSYKEGRTTDRPPFFKEAKQHLVDKWGFIIVDNIEAEDAVGICLSKYPEGIITHTDHDLNQLEGTHFNPVTNSWETINSTQAIYNLSIQLLAGCSTDKVRGLKKGIGPKTAEKMLSELHFTDYISGILKYYIKEYGEYKGIEEFYIQYKLLTILREKEEFIIPEIRQVPTKPVEEVNLEDLKF